MSFFTLAVRNLRHRLRSYAAYFLSSSFAVWLLYLYLSLVDHPDFAEVQASDGQLAPLLMFLAVVVAGFSALFVLYAHSSFLKLRQKELALLSLLGLTRGQLARTVHWENGLIGLGAVATGGWMGVVTSRLFFLALGRILALKKPVAFHFSPTALGLTAGLFAVIFAVVSLHSWWKLRSLPVAELIRDAARPKAPPRTSPWLALLCMASIGGAYWIGLSGLVFQKGEPAFLTYLTLIILGTYLLFSQGSTALLRWLQRRPGIYYRGTGLISLSQLVYKMRDNARILFMVTVLSTVALTTLGTFYSGTRKAAEQALYYAPVSVQVLASGQGRGGGPERVAELFREHGVTATASLQTAALPVVVQEPERPVNTLVLPLSQFNAWQEALGGETLDLRGRPGVITWTWPGRDAPLDLRPVRLEGVTLELPYEKLRPVVNVPLHYSLTVVADAVFASLPQGQAAVLYGYTLADWKQSLGAVEQLQQEARPYASVTATVLMYDRNRQTYGLFFFLAAFIALLFFLAAGNMLYFKLFTDLYEDRRQFQGLHKVGIRPGEIQRVVSVQTLALFLLPLLVALPHTAVFMTMAFQESGLEVREPLAAVTAVYLVLYGLYYLAARRTYVGALLER